MRRDKLKIIVEDAIMVFSIALICAIGIYHAERLREYELKPIANEFCLWNEKIDAKTKEYSEKCKKASI